MATARRLEYQLAGLRACLERAAVAVHALRPIFVRQEQHGRAPVGFRNDPQALVEANLMTTAYINFYSPINPSTVQHLMAACGNAITQGHDELYLCLSTPGGQIASGITLYNFLRSMPIKVTTHNIGSVDSIGNAVFLAGGLRRACPHSTFMFHGTAFDMLTQAHLEQKNLREMLNALLADERRIADILVERTKITSDQAGQLFAEARTKNADDAFRLGIIHEICDLAIPARTAISTLVFN
ncbi:MAG TPA: ATP-dependent Clp protease proteolytic subunit [Methylocella sp.]|nr:ATP-dependent Clp protease proteolytic subunit [Methylocella sp.]